MSRRVTDLLRILIIPALVPALLLVLSGCEESAGGGPADAPNAPRLEVVGGDTIDWGEVGGGELEHELMIVNTGREILKITDVKPSCGCTTAPLDREELAYGDTARIKVTMDVATTQGPTQKTITITTNDSTSPQRIVYLKANVVRDVFAEPNYFAITNRAPGESGSGTISLINTGSSPVTIEPPTLAGTTVMHVTFDMKAARTLGPGDTVQVTATAMSPDDKPAQVPVLFRTNNPKNPEVRVSLNVTAMPTPQDIDMSSVPPAPGN